jgi:hypothetical protein
MIFNKSSISWFGVPTHKKSNVLKKKRIFSFLCSRLSSQSSRVLFYFLIEKATTKRRNQEIFYEDERWNSDCNWFNKWYRKKITETFLKEGCKVTLCSRTEPNVNKTVLEFNEEFGDSVIGQSDANINLFNFDTHAFLTRQRSFSITTFLKWKHGYGELSED